MKAQQHTARGLTLIGAGAGSGKTHRLTGVVTGSLDPNGPSPIALEGLMAVTYTRKAAAELEGRIRRTLVAANAHERARELPLAYVGTVHAVCLRLLEEFALDAGLSPLVGVIAGDPTRALRQALEWGLDPDSRARLEELASQLEIRLDPRTKRCDWLRPVEDIMTLARSNRIAPAALRAMAERSAHRLVELMGHPETCADALDVELVAALDEAQRALASIDDGQKNTQGVRATIEAARESAQRGTLAWSRWIELSKLAPGKAARAAIAPLIEVAVRVDRHPRLQTQIHEFLRAVYEAATAGLDAYDSWKQQRRLVDFVDMVDRALSLMAIPEVSRELSQRLELIVVDEFQDTSPVQLALFAQLHQLSGFSTWVGDRKQCIFEYAGADPTLMDAVAHWVRSSSGLTEVLPDNWRSRPELVEFCSELFAAALKRHGFAPGEVVMTPQRPALPALAELPPLGLWWLQTKSQDADAEAIAEGIRRLLEAPAATPVVDRITHATRALEPADVAVLVATNAEGERVTAALARRGIRASIARAGLLDTPEGSLVEAALGCVADARDFRARALVDALTGFGGEAPDNWLEALISENTSRREARERGEPFEPRRLSEPLARLQALRTDLELLAPSETLERVLAVLDLPRLCARWPDCEQRLANIDALRALAARYEARCGEQHEAASSAGLLRFFAEAKQKVMVRDEELASDDQHVSTLSHGVTVATYHKSKGLEWPVVILGSLDRRERRDAFTVLPESDRVSFDPADPLGGRWIRYYPWPYGGQRTAALADTVATSPEGRAVREREARERVRLLYVGFTRARDHLILAVRVGKKGAQCAWLDELCDAEQVPLLSLPAETGTDALAAIEVRRTVGVSDRVAARVWSLGSGSADPIQLPKVDARRWFIAAEPALVAPTRYAIAPSRASLDWPNLELGEIGQATSTGQRIQLGSRSPKDWSTVGDVLHAFLAADLPALTPERRLEVARRLLGASDLLALLEPQALLCAGDQLRRWVDVQWPGATWYRELPVCGLIRSFEGQRRIEGTIDLLLEMPNGVVLIDHKSYPGARSTWREKALEYVPQLAAYAEVLRMAGKTVLSQWISFAVAGGVVEIRQHPRVLQNGPLARAEGVT
jgi:ATP-dependent helicase/nuclease subunit A